VPIYAYATEDFAAIVDGDLFLPPKTWADDPERRRKAGMPDEVAYRPKWRIALDMLKRSTSDGLSFSLFLFRRSCRTQVRIQEGGPCFRGDIKWPRMRRRAT
jgi:hypothetical protein